MGQKLGNIKTTLRPAWRELVRRRAGGDSIRKIAEDRGLSRSYVYLLLSKPEARAHLAALLDAMDAEFVQSMVYSPWAALLAGGKRRRTSLTRNK